MSGRSLVPALPKSSIAIAARSRGSWICEIRSARSLNCSSGESLARSCTVGAEPRECLVRPLEPCDASVSVFCMTRRPFSSVSMSVPERSAA
jgi:hypothetical protein